MKPYEMSEKGRKFSCLKVKKMMKNFLLKMKAQDDEK
jgi:hypothetical protein